MHDDAPTTIAIDGQAHDRVRIGEETPPCESPCPGCGAYYFDVHAAGCDFEQCPRCRGQLTTCGCAG